MEDSVLSELTVSGEVSPVLGGEPGRISWPGPGVCQGWWTVGERRDSHQRRVFD